MAGYIGSKASVVSSGVERKKTYSITGSTTSLTGLNYTVGKVHVFQNGVRLLDGTDYTATNGTSITLTVAAQSGDNVVVVSQASFQLSESYTSTEADAEFVTKTGDTMSGNLSFGDNDKAIFGAGSDLQIYSDGTHSRIYESGSGLLIVRASNFNVNNADGSDSYITMQDGGAVTSYYDGSAKLATTSTGIDVTGTVTADGLTVDGSTPSISNGTSPAAFTIGASNGASSNLILKGAAGMEMQTYNGGWKKYFNLAYTGDISFYEDTGTTAKFFWDASAESLGIGTSSPSGSGLHIKKDTAATTNELLRLSNSAGSTTDGVKLVMEVANTSGNGGEIGTVRDGGSFNPYMYFSTSAGVGSSPSERMRIDSSGRVGIGTSSPSALLGLNASAPDFTMLQSNSVKFRMGVSGTTNGGVTGSASGDYFARTAGGKMLFSTNDGVTAHATIDSSGNVGIGTSDPNAGIQVAKGGTGTPAKGADTGCAVFGNSTSANAYGLVVGAEATGTGYIQAQRTDGSLTTYNLKLQPNGGNLLVGTSSASGKVTIENGGNTGGLKIFQTNTSINYLPLSIHNDRVAGGSTAPMIQFEAANGADVGSIDSNISGTSYTTTSDYRLKENVVDLTGASARVNQLNPSRFNFIADDTNTLVDGFLAHEVATVVPEAITGTT